MKLECKGCKIADDPTRSVVLPGEWSLNHYCGPEGFFGWLALQTVNHRCRLADLQRSEAAALAPNLRQLERGLYKYWQDRNHPVKRVYVMYFLESQLERGYPWHLHIHLVPRFRSLARLMPLRAGGINAYRIASLRRRLPIYLDRDKYERRRGPAARADEELNIVKGVVAAARIALATPSRTHAPYSRQPCSAPATFSASR